MESCGALSVPATDFLRRICQEASILSPSYALPWIPSRVRTDLSFAFQRGNAWAFSEGLQRHAMSRVRAPLLVPVA